MKYLPKSNIARTIFTLLVLTAINIFQVKAKKIVFNRDFSPAEGFISNHEKPFRQEVCLNGYWNIQLINVPPDWKHGLGIPPELQLPNDANWEETQIKIPSPVNVNNWGGGQNVGEGSEFPYAPSSLYFPSYPKKWVDAKLVWLQKVIRIPNNWSDKRIILHFDAVGGECTVYINRHKVGVNFDTFLPFELDITDYLLDNEDNEILLGLRHSRLFEKTHPDYQYFGATFPTGSNAEDLLGIWQDVFLLAVHEVRVIDVFVKPWLNKNRLEIELTIINQSNRNQKVKLEGEIKEWINKTNTENVLTAPEIDWQLGATALSFTSSPVYIKPNNTKKIVIHTPVNSKLKKWSPNEPNLYTLLLKTKDKKTTFDCKETRFGWREFTIVNNEFHLNGEKIQCFGDIQHPFGPYICSRRFAWAWYKMIKDMGGNAVRPHAQPWPRLYYDLADEMGLLVLDETALFGSSIRLNLEENITWTRFHEHLERLIIRDRNHPSVIGWSAGNEMFAIALLNKPSKEISDKWDEKLVELALSAKKIDPTRNFITLDGDKDMNGRLPVWSKHFGHGLKLEDLPVVHNKPLIVGESGATYYGKPMQLYPFIGDSALTSYYGRNEALAIDIYQNVVSMAKPYLAYFSPSEVCWFGIEHLNLGYHDYSRLPNQEDGIFAGKPYQEGKPGYQFERIPPYVSTFNPGLDTKLPLYKELPMFQALKSALSDEKTQSCKWSTNIEIIKKQINYPNAIHNRVHFVGNKNGKLYQHLQNVGILFSQNKEDSSILIIDGEDIISDDIKEAECLINWVKENNGLIFVMIIENLKSIVKDILPLNVELTKREANQLINNQENQWGKYFTIPDLYFAEIKGDTKIQKAGLSGDFVNKGQIVLEAANVDWSLFNNVEEKRKCAQIVLFEHLHKPKGAALVSYRKENESYALLSLDYNLNTKETFNFWQNLFASLKIKLDKNAVFVEDQHEKDHNLLLNGPVE